MPPAGARVLSCSMFSEKKVRFSFFRSDMEFTNGIFISNFTEACPIRMTFCQMVLVMTRCRTGHTPTDAWGPPQYKDVLPVYSYG